MTTNKINQLCIIGITSLILLICGHLTVVQRKEQGDTRYQTIRGDSRHYIKMIENEISTASPPFKYRVLVPYLAKHLPYSPIESLRTITYLSLFLFYISVLITCLRLNISLIASISGLIILFMSPLHLYNYHNPFLTDAFGLAAISIMIYGFVRKSIIIFAIATIIGLLGRYSCIFLVPVWVLKDRFQGIVIIIISFLLLLYIRMEPQFGNVVVDYLQWNRISDILNMVKDILWSWRHVWILMLLGICLFPKKKFKEFGIIFCLLFIGALLTSLIATDIQRLFNVLSPIVVLSSANFFLVLDRNKYQYLVYYIVAASILGGLITFPTVLIGEEVIIGCKILNLTSLIINSLIILFATILIREKILRAQTTK